jgi:hypothetical protein
MQTSMRPNTQRLLDDLPAIRTVLGSVVGWNSNRDHAKNLPKILDPLAELSPRCIRYRFGKVSIPHHITHLQVLIGYQVVRLDHAPCCLHGKVFTLPTYLEVLTSKFISKLSSILGTFFSLGQTTLKSLQRLFRLAEMTWVGNSLPIRISVKMVQPNIYTDIMGGWFSFLQTFLIDAKLYIIPVCSTDNPHPFKLLQLVFVQITGSPHFEGSRIKSIRKGDTPSIG